ncbi:hypothetical protein MKW98_015797 [Papaver atlanticum]|uniref:Uncharacterized protein n=1 Tax=Papaver atlanticum TaxID=357466 RepID=A0AAD4XD74_9MAGN|nr:hypothetical protein MKW98_015797 [Papaver atlanticum]
MCVTYCRDKVFESQKLRLTEEGREFGENVVMSLRTLVNLGSEVYMQADVLDTRHIFVDVGVGLHVEFTWTEALEFISLKEARLAKYVLLLLLHIYFDSIGLVLHGLSNKWK